MGRSRGSAWWVGVALALAALAAPAAAVADGGAKAKITRSAHGIPTIEADELQGPRLRLRLRLRRGQHLHDRRHLPHLDRASARAGSAPTPRAPRASPTSTRDLFYQRVKRPRHRRGADRPASRRWARRRRSSRASRATSRATTATWRRPGSRTSPTRAAPAQPWVRPITKMDVYRRFYELALYASGGRRDRRHRQRPAAAPRARARRPTSAPRPRPPRSPPAERARVEELGEALDLSDDIGSNAWGLGSEATESGGGIVLANPHFPWQGPRRFYQSHLVIPGKINVSGREPVRRAGRSSSATPRSSPGATRSRPRSASRPFELDARPRPTRPATWSTASRCRWRPTRSRSRSSSPTARSRR